MESLYYTLPKFKDNIVAIIAIDYGLGFIIWCFYSYKNSLGNISVFQAQYLLAGIVPLLLISITLWLLTTASSDMYRLKSQFHRNSKGSKYFIRYLLITLYWASSLLLLAVGVIFLYELIRGFVPTIRSSSLVLLLMILFFLKLLDYYPYITRKNRKNFQQLLRKIRDVKKTNANTEKAFVAGLYFVFLVAIPSYFIYIYPTIPQELGGAKPKKCIFTSNKKELYNSTLLTILNIDTIKGSEGIISDTILIYYYNDNKIIGKKSYDDNTVYEIDRKNINSIIWIKE